MEREVIPPYISIHLITYHNQQIQSILGEFRFKLMYMNNGILELLDNNKEINMINSHLLKHNTVHSSI